MFTSRRRREAKPGVQIPTAGQVVSNLFGAGEPGLMLSEFDVFANLFQDGPGTVPVTAVGQPVGRANDLSGRGNFATFSNCTLQQDGGGRNYLAFNGTTTSGVTASINFTATDKMTLWAGLTKQSDAATAVLMESSVLAGNSNPGSMALFAPLTSATAHYAFRAGGTLTNNATTPSSYAAPITNVVCCIDDIAGASTLVRVNATQVVSNAASQGTGNFGNYQIFIGRRAGTTLPFTGSLYSLIIRGAASSAGQITSTEAYVNSKTGAF